MKHFKVLVFQVVIVYFLFFSVLSIALLGLTSVWCLKFFRLLQEHEESAEVKQKSESYLSHPINQYHLIKSISTKTTEISQIVSENQSMGNCLPKRLF